MDRVRAGDFDALSSLLSNVTYATVNTGDLTAQSDENLTRLVHYMQACMQYMMHVQQVQAAQLSEVETRLRTASELVSTHESTISTLKKDLHAKHKTMRAYETALTASKQLSASSQATNALGGAIALTELGTNTPGTPQVPAVVFKCGLCPKAFKTAEYLEEHVARRHPGAPRTTARAVVASAAQPPPPPSMEDTIARAAAEAALAEVRTQRDALARELEERNRQLSEALHSARTASLALESATRTVQIVPASPTRAENEQLAAFQATISSLQSQLSAQQDAAARREAEQHDLEQLAVRQLQDAHVREMAGLRGRLVELEQTMAAERARAETAAVMASRAGPLLDEETEDEAAERERLLHEATRRASIEAGERAAAATAAAVADHMNRLESRLEGLADALNTSEIARERAEAAAALAAAEAAAARAAAEAAASRPGTPPPAPQPEPQAGLPPAPATPEPAPLPPAFVLSYTWQRLPEDVRAWSVTGASGSGLGASSFATIADAPGHFGVDVLAGTPLENWRTLLPAETQISNTSPPRVRVPPEWDVRMRVTSDENSMATLELFSAHAGAGASVVRPNAAPKQIQMRVRRTTTLSEIRESISKQLSIPMDVFALCYMLDDARVTVFSPTKKSVFSPGAPAGQSPNVRVLMDEETVESAELFTRRPTLIFAAAFDDETLGALIADYMSALPNISDALLQRMQGLEGRISPELFAVLSQVVKSRAGPQLPPPSDTDLQRAREAVVEEVRDEVARKRGRARSAAPSSPRSQARAARRAAQVAERLAGQTAGADEHDQAEIRAASDHIQAQLAAAEAALDYVARPSRGSSAPPTTIRRERVEAVKENIMSAMAAVLSTAISSAAGMPAAPSTVPPALAMARSPLAPAPTPTTLTPSASQAGTPRGSTVGGAAQSIVPAAAASPTSGGFLSLFRRNTRQLVAPPPASEAPGVTSDAAAFDTGREQSPHGSQDVRPPVPSAFPVGAGIGFNGRRPVSQVTENPDAATLSPTGESPSPSGFVSGEAVDESVLDVADQYEAEAARAAAAMRPASVESAEYAGEDLSEEGQPMRREPVELSSPSRTRQSTLDNVEDHARPSSRPSPSEQRSASGTGSAGGHRAAARVDASAVAAALADMEREREIAGESPLSPSAEVEFRVEDEEELTADEFFTPDHAGQVRGVEHDNEDAPLSPETHFGETAVTTATDAPETSLTTFGLGATQASAFGALEQTLETEISELSATHEVTAAPPPDEASPTELPEAHGTEIRSTTTEAGDARAGVPRSTGPAREVMPARGGSHLASVESLALSAATDSTGDAATGRRGSVQGAYADSTPTMLGGRASTGVRTPSPAGIAAVDREEVVQVLTASASSSSLPAPARPGPAAVSTQPQRASAAGSAPRSAAELLDDTDLDDTEHGADTTHDTSAGGPAERSHADEYEEEDINIEEELERYVPSARGPSPSASTMTAPATVITPRGAVATAPAVRTTSAASLVPGGRGSLISAPPGTRPGVAGTGSASQRQTHAEDILEDLDEDF